MANFALPRMDDYIEGYNVLPPRPKERQVEQAPQQTTYDMLTPQQQKEIDLQLKPRSALAEIGTGIKRGIFHETPKRFGQALQAPGEEGGLLFNWGKAARDYAETQDLPTMLDPNTKAHNIVTRSMAEGVSQIIPSVAPLAALPALAVAGVPGAVGMGAVALAGGLMAGGSQFTDTYEKAIKAGKSPEQARQLGLETGVAEGLGDTAMTALTGGAIKGGKALLGAMGGKMTPQAAIKALQNPAFLKDLGKLTGMVSAGEVGTEMAQSYATAAIEKNAEIDTADPYEAAVGSIAPTLGAMPFLLPLMGFGLRGQQRHNQKLVQQATAPDPTLSDSQQVIQAQAAGRELQPVLEKMTGDKQAAVKWRLDQISNLNKQHAASTAEAKQALAEQQAKDNAPMDQSELAGPGPGMTPEEYRQQTVSQAAAIPQPRPMTDPTTRSQYTAMFEGLLQERDVAESAGRFWQQPAGTPTGPGGTTRPFLKTMEDMRRAQTAPEQQTAPTPYAESVEAMRKQPELEKAKTARMAAMQRTRDATKAVASVETAKTEEDRKAAVAQVIVNPPEGALTFSEFTAEMNKQQRSKKGELPLTGGKIAKTEGSLRDAYVGYINSHLQVLNQTLEAPRVESKSVAPGIPEGQQALGLPEVQQEQTTPSPTSLPLSGKTVMEEKLGAAQTKAEKHATFTAHESEQAARAEAERGQLADINARVETAARNERLVNLAQTGQITGNTPLHINDLVSGWQETAQQFSLDTKKLAKSKSRDAMAFKGALDKAGSQKLFAAQLNTLRHARDKMKETSLARETMDAFVKRLEGQHAVQVAGPEGQVSRAGEAGQDQQQNRAALGQGEQRNETATTQPEGTESQRTQGQATSGFAQRNGPTTRAQSQEKAAVVSRARRRVQGAIHDAGKRVREDFERRLGKSYETMTQEQQQEVQLAYNEAIDNSFLYHNSIDKISIDEHRYDPNIETAVRNGDLEGVLNAVEASPYGQRFQPLVDRIRGLGLHTRFEASDAVSHPKFQNIVNKEIEYARRQKGEWDGAYSHLLDVVVLHNFSPKTAMHELVHAATIMRVKLAEAARLIPWEQRTPQQHALINDLTELEALFAKAKRVSKNRKAYGFTDIHEFLAEANSSETFQNELKSMTYEGVRIWQELLKWIRNTLGRVDANFNNALEHALDLTVRFENPDVDGLLETAEPNHDVVGPIHSMRRTDQGMVQATGWWEKMLQSAASKGNVGQRTTKALLQAFSTWHIQEWFSKSPSLRPISDSIKAYFAADSVKTQMVQNTSAEFAAQHRSLELAIQKLPTSDARRAMEREISFLALEMSGLNIDLNMGYPLNTHRNPNLERSAAMRDYVNNLHRRYMALPQNIRTPMEMTFALNRKNFIQKTSTMVRNYLQLQERTLGPQVHRWISRLDIRDPSLDQGSTPQRAPNQLPYYADAYTKNLDERLQTILREMQQSNISGEFEGIAKFYSSAVKNPYQHLGRFGDNFVEFQIQGSAQALAQIQQVLAPFNKVIGQPAAGNRHVFMRFEDAGERDKAFAAVKALGGNVATDLRGGSLEDRSHLQTAKGVPDFARSMISKLDATFDTTGMSQSEQDLLNEMHQSIKRWALDSIPETSSRKALSSRNIGRTLGYEADFMRSYTTRATSMTSTLANAYAMPLFNKAFADMKKAIDPLAKQDPALHSEAQMVHDEIAKRFANGLHPVESPIIDYGKAFGYNFFLAMSPSFWMVNLAQPWHLTFPYLGGHFGFVKSARAMGNASAKSLIIIKNTIAKGIAEGQALGGTRGAILGAIDAEIQLGTLSPGEAAFVRALASAGHLDSTQGHELGRAAEGTDPRLVATNKFMSAGSHYTEVMNRITAGLAGYNLELARSGGNAVKATERGMKAVAHTQFSYTDANIGRAWGRHGLALKYTPLLASFQQYSFQTMELLLRMVRDATFPIPENATPDQRREILLERRAAQKGLAGVMGTTSVIAGTMGLPFANVAARLVDALVDAWGDDDDEAWKAAGGDIAGGGAQGGDWGTPGAIPGQEGDWSDEVKRPGPSDIRSAYRSWLAGWAGKDLAEIIARGAPRALGFDVSARAGLQDLLPGSRFFTDRREMQDRMKDGVFNMMGPAVSAGMNMVNGISHMYDGRVMDGLIEFLPLALAGPAKAIRMEQVGYINATGNQLPLEVTGWDEFVQTVGFTPAKKAEQSEVNYSFKTRDLILKQQKNRLANSLYIEFERQGELTPEHMQSLEEWNTRYPEYKIDVGAALAARAKARGVAEISGTDIAALPRFMSVLNQYGYANTQ